MSNWHSKGLAEWVEDNTAYLSVVFSWKLPEAYQKAIWYAAQGYHVRAGGPAVILNPEYLMDVAEVGGEVDALQHHNPNATFTSRGCIRKCPFCAVPRIEGDLVELDDWEPKPTVCDNNLLACSTRHFDTVIDRLKPLHHVDFEQGLDARLLTKHHAERLAELDLHAARLAWDDVRLETQVHDAIQRLRAAGIGKKKIKCYVLIGFRDTPEDARYRLETLKWEWGIDPYPMRFQPLDTPRKNSYVAPGWTDTQLKNLVRFWCRTRWLGAVPFDEYKRAPGDRPWLRRDTLPV